MAAVYILVTWLLFSSGLVPLLSCPDVITRFGWSTSGIFWTTRKAAWYIILVLRVCLYVCQTITFERLEVHICTCGIFPQSTGQVSIWRSSGQGQGHRSQKGRKFIFSQCKTSISNNSCCVQHGVFGYGGSNGVTAVFVTWPKVTVS